MDNVAKTKEEVTKLIAKAKEQIAKAEQILQEAEKKIAEAGSAKVPDVVATLLGEAKENLAKAKSAFEEEKYGEAFGQARSAEVLARNALRFFEREKPQTENFEQRLKYQRGGFRQPFFVLIH